MDKLPKSIGILGFGRFGKALAGLLSKDFDICVFDIQSPKTTQQITSTDLHSLLKESTIFIAVPIHAFEKTITDIADKLAPGTTIIDVCSVKVHPVKLMREHLPESIDIIATHPLFGPDSIKESNEHSLKMMMHKERDAKQFYSTWKDYFSQNHIEVIEMTPEEHDQLAARSQGITHLIGRVLNNAELKNTPIDTLGFKKLLEVIKQTCNDSWELFYDLQRFNPYSEDMINKIESSLHDIHQKILKSRSG